MFKLYYAPQSCSLIPHILLEEFKTDYDIQLVNLKIGEQFSDAFLKINPKAKIPVLQHKESCITETIAIVNYLAGLHPENELLPTKNIKERAAIEEWMVFFSSTVHIIFGRIFRPNRFVDDEKYYENLRKVANRQLEGTFTKLDQFMAPSKYLTGENMRACDIFLFNYGRWGNLAQKPTKEYPHLHSFMQRMAEHPTIKKILEVEGINLYRDIFPVMN